MLTNLKLNSNAQLYKSEDTPELIEAMKQLRLKIYIEVIKQYGYIPFNHTPLEIHSNARYGKVT
jgi:hypothetical protein